MTRKFDNTVADAQATPVEPVKPADFDFDRYAEYSRELDDRCKTFWESDSGVMVYRRVRVASCFSAGCKDMAGSLENQLGALEASMKYRADVPNFLEPWYGIGTIASAYNDEYSWLPGAAPALEPVFSSIEEILDKTPTAVSETRIGRHTLKMIDYFMEQTEGRLPISLTDTQSPLNISGNLMPIGDFLLNTIMNPDAIASLFEILADLSIDFNAEQQKRMGDALVYPGHGFASSREWKGLGMSDDNILMVSPEQYYDLTWKPYARITGEFGGFAFHSCGNWEHWIRAVRKKENVLMVDGAFSEQTDPGAITNLESFHQFAEDRVVVNARIVGDLETIEEKVKRIWVHGMKLIVVTYCRTPEEQERAYDMIHTLCT